MVLPFLSNSDIVFNVSLQLRTTASLQEHLHYTPRLRLASRLLSLVSPAVVTKPLSSSTSKRELPHFRHVTHYQTTQNTHDFILTATMGLERVKHIVLVRNSITLGITIPSFQVPWLTLIVGLVRQGWSRQVVRYHAAGSLSLTCWPLSRHSRRGSDGPFYPAHAIYRRIEGHAGAGRMGARLGAGCRPE
jgi:hypothetical protein